MPCNGMSGCSCPLFEIVQVRLRFAYQTFRGRRELISLTFRRKQAQRCCYLPIRWLQKIKNKVSENDG